MFCSTCYIPYASNQRLYNQRGFWYVERFLLYNKKICYIAHPNLPDVEVQLQKRLTHNQHVQSGMLVPSSSTYC